MDKTYYNVSGMTCSACSAHVEKAVKAVNGVTDVQVNLLTNSMVINGTAQNEDIVNAVQKAGYGAAPKNALSKNKNKQNAQKERETQLQNENKKMQIRLFVSLGLLVPLMYVSMGHMVNLPLPSFLHGTQNAVSFAMVQFLLTLPIVYVNRVYYERGFKALLNKSPNMDSLVAIGSFAALIYGIFAIMRIGTGLGTGNIELVHQYSADLYFESAAMILALITLGKYWEEKSKRKTNSAITKLLELAPQIATIQRNDKEITVDIDEVAPGDIVILRPGQGVPVDGIITEGYSSLQEAMLTGESLPKEKTVGDNIMAGSINENGFIKYKATKTGENTTVAQIIRLVEEASAGKAPISKTADKISAVFVPTVIVIAIISAVVWLLLGMGAEFALSSAIAVLVISCPCALGLATPVAIMVGTGKGAQHGILIKSGEALESAHSVTHVVLDKTGTVTKGKPVVTDVYSVDENDKSWLQWAYGLEKASEHPLASAIVNYSIENSINEKPVENMNAIFGKGVVATLGEKTVISGNEALLLQYNIALPNDIKQRSDNFASNAKTPIYFAINGQVCGIIAVADILKDDAKDEIQSLKNMGLNITLLTGDNEKTAKAIANSLGIENVISGVLPHEKENEIAKLKNKGEIVAMVGDGTNDAPALASAHVGIAIGAGTDIAIESADIVLMKNSISDVKTALSLSKAVIINIKQNLFWAFFYNIIGIPIAAGVLYLPFGLRLSPMLGAAAMSLSSIFVVTNALRLRKFKAQTAKEQKAITINQTKQREILMNNFTLSINGMMCEHCSSHVKKALEAIEGVKAEVNLAENKAICTSDAQLNKEELIKAVEQAGYTATEL